MTATVSSPSTRSPSIRKVRDLRRVERRVAAVVLLVPGIAAALSRLFTTDDSDARKALDLVAADPGRQFTLSLLGFIAMLTMVPAFLAAARLARRRRPLLTMIALGVNLIAYLSGWAVTALDTMYLAGSRLPVEQRDGAAALIDAMWSEGLTGTSTMIMVIGQLLGAILMGLALRGSIPTVGWVAMILSQPIHILAFALNMFDPAALAWGLTALAFACCAVTVLRTPDGEWDLPPLATEGGTSMTTAALRSTSTRSTRPRKARDVRRVRRIVAAVILLVPATTIAVGRLFVTDDSDTRKALDLIAADPGRQFTFALLGFFAMLTVVPAFLAAARLAKRRRPVLTMIALGVNLIAYLGGWALAAIDNMYLAGAMLPVAQRDGAAALIDAMWSDGLAGISTLLMVIGHVLGAILMGLALRGSIPAVGWVAMILSQPGHVFAFVVLPSPVMDALAWGLMALAFAICAVTVLRTPDDEWDLPPRS